MENDHLISGLLRKRTEIAGEIAYHQERWRQLSADLMAVDSTIQIVAPGRELGEAVRHFVPPPHQAYKGEISRLVADAFRLTPDRALSTMEIAEHVMRSRSLNADDPALRRLMVKRVGACLAQWRKKGRVGSEPGPEGQRGGEGGFLWWRLAAAHGSCG